METFGLAMLAALMIRTEAPIWTGYTEVEVRVRLHAAQTLAPPLVADVNARVTTILAGAGIRLTWIECGELGDAVACGPPQAPGDLDIVLVADWHSPSGASCRGAIRLGDGARRFSISLAWVQSTAAAMNREPAEVLARSVAHQVGHAWSPTPHPARGSAADAAHASNEPTLSPRDVVLLAGALLQHRTTDHAAPARERMILLAPNGRWLSVIDGLPGVVLFDAEVSLAIATPDAGLTVVHNHPGSRGLSVSDISSLSSLGLMSVEAIGHDGSVYIAKRGRAFRPAAYHMAAALLEVAIRGLPPSTNLRATIDAHFAHLVCLVLQSSEIIEYEAKLAGERAGSFRRHGLRLAQAVNVASHMMRKSAPQRRKPESSDAMRRDGVADPAETPISFVETWVKRVPSP